MENRRTERPLACAPDAIPAADRAAHFQRIRRLFARGTLAKRKHPGGYAYRFPPGALRDVASFVDHERRCCPFLTFAIEVPAGGGAVWLRITGPEGIRALLDAELPT